MSKPTSGEALAEALRLLRTARGLSQTAAGQLPGAPDFRTLSHWETRRKQPSMRLLTAYLASLSLDFHDLQDALDQAGASGPTASRIEELVGQVDRLARVVASGLDQRAQSIIDRRQEMAVGRLVVRLDGIDERLDAIDGGKVPADQVAGLDEMESLRLRLAKLEQLVAERAGWR